MDSECIVCNMRQALDMCKFISADETGRQQVMQRVMEILVRRDEIEHDRISPYRNDFSSIKPVYLLMQTKYIRASCMLQNA